LAISYQNLLKRSLVLAVGLFMMALGVAISTRANLGVTPISSAIYVMSAFFPITMGETTILVHTVFILIQILLLRKNFQIFQLTQLLTAFVFGFFTDFTLWLTDWIVVSSYILQWSLCILSWVIIAFGVWLEVKSNLIMLAGEGLTLTISNIFNIEFGKVKMGFDISQVLIAVVFSLIAFHGLVGVREGTIAAALAVGNIVCFYDKNIRFVDVLLAEEKNKDFSAKTAVEN